MSPSAYEWARAEERTLARYVQPAILPKEFSWPSYINRLDLLQAEGPRGVVAQLYQVVCKQKIQYDLSPFNPHANATQFIRKPATILSEKQATCLDLAVLFASLGLASDLLPVIVTVEGHALVGFSLTRTRHTNRTAPKPLAWDKGRLADLSILRELTGQEYLFVECTGAAHSQSLTQLFPEGRGRESNGQMSFDRACVAGEEQIRVHARLKTEPARENQREFLYALDIHDLQTKYGFEPQPESPDSAAPGNASQIVQGPQTNIKGQVNGPVLSGEFNAPVTVGDITVGNISGSTGLAIGHGAQVTVNQNTGLASDDVARLFALLTQKVNALPEGTKKEDAQDAVKKLETEAKKADQADEGRVRRSMEFLVEVLPDAWEVTVNTLLNPLAGLNTVFKKIAERVKVEREKKDMP
jgi:hypothetical protein